MILQTLVRLFILTCILMPYQVWAVCSNTSDYTCVTCPAGQGGDCREPVDLTRATFAATMADSVDGDAIYWKAGTSATWTSGYSETTAKNVSIYGHGIGNTVINIPNTQIFLQLFFHTGPKVRISGFTVEGDSNGANGIINLVGTIGTDDPETKGLEIDNVHFHNVGNYNFKMDPTAGGEEAAGNIFGVVHDCTFDGYKAAYKGVNISTGYGLVSETLGSANAFFFEGNIINFDAPYTNQDVVDSESPGYGKTVFRFNTITNAYMEVHGAHHDPACSEFLEWYHNSVTLPDTDIPWQHQGSGEVMVFGNVYTMPTRYNFILKNYREGCTKWYSAGCAECAAAGADCVDTNYCVFTGSCGIDCSMYHDHDNGSASDFAKWAGRCDGTNSYDGNYTGQYGYPCRWQLGTVWTGAFSGTLSKFSPLYFWNNSYTADGETFSPLTPFASELCAGNSHPNDPVISDSILPDRDYYVHRPDHTEWCNETECLYGVGVGETKAASCTTGSYTGQGVGWWVPSEKQLYRCDSTNHWTPHYQPYTCPHPLSGNTGSCDYTKAGRADGYNVGGAQTVVITEVTPVPTPSSDITPSYTFNSDTGGAVTYGGDCLAKGNLTTATAGDNTVTWTFDAITGVGVHNNCTVNIGNGSLPVAAFTISAPTVAITAPSAGVLNGTTTLTATCSHAEGCSSVEFRRSNWTINTDSSSPYTYDWDTTNVPNGNYSLLALATATGGSKAYSSPVAISIYNPTTGGPHKVMGKILRAGSNYYSVSPGAEAVAVIWQGAATTWQGGAVTW